MIRYVSGDIFNSKMQTIVNPVNCVGVMGKGLALQFKYRYPHSFQMYKQACDKHLLMPGRLMLTKERDHAILMFPTKDHWSFPSRLEWIETGLYKFVENYQRLNITSIAFNKLGCGNGGLDWNKVKPLMERYLNDLPIKVEVYI